MKIDREFKTMEEWNKINEEWEKNHPILHQLQEIYYWFYRLWFNKIVYIPKEIKWFYQRGRRGYSDSDVWDFDNYLAKIISGGCKHLSEKANGFPMNVNSIEEWKDILDKINIGFIEYIKIQDYEEEYKNMPPEEYNKKMDELFLLLRKYFSNLWD